MPSAEEKGMVSNSETGPETPAISAPDSAAALERHTSMNHFNNLTPAQAERLALLAEECGECIHMIGKVLRHGYNSRHPDGGHTNQTLLAVEVAHANYALNFMVKNGDLMRGVVNEAFKDRARTIQRYLHHQDKPRCAACDYMAAHKHIVSMTPDSHDPDCHIRRYWDARPKDTGPWPVEHKIKLPNWLRLLYFYFSRVGYVAYSVVKDEHGNVIFEGTPDDANHIMSTCRFPGSILTCTTTWEKPGHNERIGC